jgi:hypothetical protein
MIYEELEKLFASVGTGMRRVFVEDENGYNRLTTEANVEAQALGPAEMFGAGAKPDIYALSQAAGAPVTEAEVGGTMAGFVPGKIAGAIGAPGDIAALATGIYKAAFPDPEQGRLEAFITQVEEISNKFGSGATLGFLDDWATQSGISEEAKQGFLQGAEVGSFFGFGQGAKATGKGVVAAGKAVVEGAPARIAERQQGVTLGMGVDPMAPIDPALAAAGKLVRGAEIGQGSLLSEAGEAAIKTVGSLGTNRPLTKENLEKADEVTKLLVSKILKANPDAALGLARSGSAAGDSNYLTFVNPDGAIGQIRISDHSTGERRMSDYFEMLPMKIPPEGEQVFGQISRRSFDNKIDKIVNEVAFGGAGKLVRPTKENPVTAVPPTETEPGIIAFHGSGADFDQFSLEKIGTGEGAQAYGYGLYFTDSEDIAKFYRDTVQFNQRMRGNTLNINYQGKPFEDLGDTAAAEAAPPSYTAIKSIADEMARYLPANPKMAKPELAKERLLARIDTQIEKYSKAGQSDADVGTIELQGGGTLEDLMLADLQQQKQALLDINSEDIQPATGKMYKVGLEPKPEDMLDYEKSISEQSQKVQDALYANEEIASIIKRKQKEDGLPPEFYTGEELYADLAENLQSPQAASNELADAGILGLKYTAAGSRGANIDAADVEKNYVIFDDKAIKILEKYGIVGPVAITALGAAKQEGEDNANST